MSKVIEAAKFAALWHTQPESKAKTYGNHPYWHHLSQVVRVLQWAGITDENVLAAAWLHDVVEDTIKTMDEIEEKFGPEVASIVWACTSIAGNRRERSADMMSRMRVAGIDYPFEFKLVKMADRIANMENSKDCRSDLRKMYDSEFDGFFAATENYVYSDKKEFHTAFLLLRKRLASA